MAHVPPPPSTPQLAAWTGAFGDAYVERNAPTPTIQRDRVRAFASILRHTDGDPPQSILECGCNVGLNLRALGAMSGAELFAIEPNARARATVLKDAVVEPTRLHEATLAALPFADRSIDLVFTCGVLIHVAPPDLDRALDEVHRVARKYVLAIEYFSQQPEEAPYRGHGGLLWKRDFGLAYLERFPDLSVIEVGFLWKPTSGWDDATWWLFRKG